MTKVHARFQSFYILRVLSRVRSPSHQQYKKTEGFYKCDDLSVSSGKSIEVSFCNEDTVNTHTESPNRVMVVVDWSVEAKSALQWALSHTVQSQDTIVLVHIVKPTKKGDFFVSFNNAHLEIVRLRLILDPAGVDSNNEQNQRAYELLSSMKNLCQMKRPGVNVEISIQEGKDKGAIIVEEAKERKVSLLVLGQRKRSVLWHLQMMWAGKISTNRVVEYCIQNANCMTIAVRRKGKRRGGYLITTKRHKNFWLLA